jgi:photoactive yellow protein
MRPGPLQPLLTPQISLLGTLFDSLPLGVVVLDAQGRVLIYNREEERLAQRSRDRVIGKQFFREVAPCMNVKELGQLFESKIGHEPIDVAIDFSFPFPFLEQPRDVTVRMVSFDVDDQPHVCLLIRDISAERSMERMKETLTSLLVHDFKNPLSVIISNLSFVREDPQLAARADLENALRDAERAASRLQGMVIGLLDINRLERGEMPLQRAPVDVRELVRQAAEQSQALGRSRSIEIAVEVPETPLTAELDKGLVRRALDNLIENAFRYSPRKGVVRVRARSTNLGVCLEVADDGPGIPTLIRQQIFEKYVQVKKSEDAGSHNRGLGLTFVRLAARAHGGDATVICPAGGGSIFRFEVPARLPANRD